jgi:DNA-directed RNA polymerase subunit omega
MDFRRRLQATANPRCRALARVQNKPNRMACGPIAVIFRRRPDMGRVRPGGFLKCLPMRDDYIKEALKTIDDPNILVNVVSRRVKQLKRGNRPLVESLEKLSAEDTALREIIEGKISYELASTTARS